VEELETRAMTQETAEEEDLFKAEDFETDENGELRYAAEKPAAEPEPWKLHVKYMGEEKDLTQEEAVTFAQKGMDYDPIKKELGELKAGGAHEALKLEKQLADSMGLTVAEYRKAALDQVQNARLQKELAAVNKEFPGMPADAATALAQARIGQVDANRKSAAEQQEAETWTELAEAYPELKSAEDIPSDVREAIEQGKEPLLAMREHEIAALKAQLAQQAADAAAKEQNNNNKQKAAGPVKPGSGTEIDPFLQGLFG